MRIADWVKAQQGLFYTIVHTFYSEFISYTNLLIHRQVKFKLNCPRIHNDDYESAEYRVTAITFDTAQYRLFRPVRSDLLSTDAKTHFIKRDFINKGIDAVNLPSILRSKSVTETVPTYFKEKEPPIISYIYTKAIASKIFIDTCRLGLSPVSQQSISV